MATTITQAPAQPLQRRLSRHQRINLRNGLLFTAPGIIGLLWFYAYPVLGSFFYSFTSYDGLHSLSWIGLSNYINLAKDSVFWTSLYNTAYFVMFSVPLNLVAAFMLALLLNQRWIRGLAFFRTIFFVPSIVPLVASSVLWLWMQSTMHHRPVTPAEDYYMGQLANEVPNALYGKKSPKKALDDVTKNVQSYLDGILKKKG